MGFYTPNERVREMAGDGWLRLRLLLQLRGWAFCASIGVAACLGLGGVLWDAIDPRAAVLAGVIVGEAIVIAGVCPMIGLMPLTTAIHMVTAGAWLWFVVTKGACWFDALSGLATRFI